MEVIVSLAKIRSRSLWICLTLGLLLPGAVLAQEPTQTTAPQPPPVTILKEVSFQKIEIAEQLQVMIKVEGPFFIETFELVSPKRLVIDFSSVPKIEAAPIIQVNDLGVLNIRTGQFQSTVARVVFDLDVRTPSHSITTMPDGVKVTFWLEPLPQPVVPEEKPAVGPEEKPFLPAVKRPFLFLRGGPGLTFFLKPTFVDETEYEIYGETATITETFDRLLGPVFDLCLGKTLGSKWTVGLGASFHLMGVSPSLAASLPHPFLYDAYRDVAYTADDISANMWALSSLEAEPREVKNLTTGLWNIYTFALYSLIQTEKLEISAGPLLGFSFGKFHTLYDMEIDETAPYESQNISLSSVTFLENSFFKIDPGIMVSGAYRLNDKLSLYLSVRLHYMDIPVGEVEVVEVPRKYVSLFRLNALLGLQYGF